jgi:uncharacterized membrane protein required for colicin V production
VAFRLLLYGGLLAAAVWGSPLLRVAAICAIPLALLVDWEGGVRHVLRWGAVALAMWLAPQYGSRLGDVVSTHWGLSSTIGNLVGIAIIATVIIAMGAILARLASRHVRRGRFTGACDHMLGGILGSAEASVAVVTVCWLLAAFSGPIATLRARTQQQQLATSQPSQQRILNTLSNLAAAVRGDPTGQWLLQRNPLEKSAPVQTAGLMLELTADPGALLSAADQGRLDAIAALPEVRKYIEAIERDPQLREALQNQDIVAVLSHPLVKSMLADAELRRALLENLEQLRKALGLEHEALGLDDEALGSSVGIDQ